MKINAINNDKYNTPKNSTNKNTPSFSARVQYYKELKDVVTDEVINIEHGPLRMLMDKITPYLQNLEDDNLIVTISGAQKKPEFWDIFRTGEPIRGLKFDLNYFDLKRFYLLRVKLRDRAWRHLHLHLSDTHICQDAPSAM